MLRESGYQPEYGLIGAGAVNASIIGHLPGKTRALGPVSGISFRVASRIANTLKAGHPVRSADELEPVRVILFHAPKDQSATLLGVLKSARIQWPGKSLVFCDCEPPEAIASHFRTAGASVAVARRCDVAGRIVVEGHAPALTFAHRMARDLRMKAIEIAPGTGNCFEAAVTLGTGALTPLIDCAAALLKESGLRDTEAVEIASALFGQTVRDYAHSGRQSWVWYIREPETQRIKAQLAEVEEPLRELLRQLILLGLQRFEKHSEAAHGIAEEEKF